jgi:hypothetical protein
LTASRPSASLSAGCRCSRQWPEGSTASSGAAVVPQKAVEQRGRLGGIGLSDDGTDLLGHRPERGGVSDAHRGLGGRWIGRDDAAPLTTREISESDRQSRPSMKYVVSDDMVTTTVASAPKVDSMLIGRWSTVELVDLEAQHPSWEQALPVLRELRPHLTAQGLQHVLREGAPQGLRFLGVSDDDGRCLAVAG